ncbi:MAG: hypothetical protein SGPRY_002513, partial [Prymnesium sp.]
PSLTSEEWIPAALLPTRDEMPTATRRTGLANWRLRRRPSPTSCSKQKAGEWLQTDPKRSEHEWDQTHHACRSETSWRMAVETVRERCMQGLQKRNQLSKQHRETLCLVDLGMPAHDARASKVPAPPEVTSLVSRNDSGKRRINIGGCNGALVGTPEGEYKWDSGEFSMREPSPSSGRREMDTSTSLGVQEPPLIVRSNQRAAQVKCDAMLGSGGVRPEAMASRGSLEFLDAIDAFDFRLQRHGFRSYYAEYGIKAMQAQRLESELKKLRNRMSLLEAMQHYLEHELPLLERNAREKMDATVLLSRPPWSRVDANVTIRVTLNVDFLDESVQYAFIEDVNEWLGIPAGRIRAHSVEKVPHLSSERSNIIVTVSEGSGKTVEDICQEIKIACNSGSLEDNWVQLRRQLPLAAASRRIETLSAVITPSHFIVHDARTLADRAREATTAWESAQSELIPLTAKQQQAASAQAQLWKMEGVENTLPQCHNRDLLEARSSDRPRKKSKLAQLARDAEIHVAHFTEAEARAVNLEARSEAIRRLIACSQADLSHFNQDTPAKTKKHMETREYSTNALREVSQQLLREKRQLEAKLKSMTDLAVDLGATNADSSIQKKYQTQGALQLLKDIHAKQLQRVPY